MAIPEFYRFMRPSLEILADGQPRHVQEIVRTVASRFGLSDPEIAELIPSGRKTRVRDRTEWSLTYLRQARLVDRTKPGTYKITERGGDYLTKAPQVIKPDELRQFPEFVDFLNRSATTAPPSTSASTPERPAPDSGTPQEMMGAAFRVLNVELARQLLDQVKSMSPAFFEQLIVDLMLRLGYGGPASDAGMTLGRSGDEGVDGVIKQDKLGLDNIYLQAKRWSQGPVGRKEVQAFVGALYGQGASKGVFITTSQFTKEAVDYARNTPNIKLSLVDGEQLAVLMIEHDLGVSVEKRYDVKRVDSDYFTE
jgi:restriction system protein